jgi:hypothetical protein
MKKLIFSLLGLFCFAQSYSQTITGGAGVCVVSDDPDNIPAMQQQDARYECVLAWDNTNQALYLYDSTATSGNRWTAVPLSDVVDTDTRLDNPRVSGTDLVFDLYDEKTDTDIGDISVPITDIAPVQGVTAGTGISITDDGNGNFTITNTATSNGTDELQTLSNTFPDGATGRFTLSDGGGSVDVVEGTAIDIADDGSGNIQITNTAPDQTVGVTGGTGISVSGTYPNFTVTNSSPSNATDEVQDLSLAGNTLSLTQDATPVDLSAYLDNTDTQDLSIVGNTLSLTDGGSVTVDGDVDNEAQTLGLAVLTGTATIDLTDVGAVDGGAVTISQGDGITVTSGGGNDAQITNTEFAAVAADDHADAGVQGVAIGEYFYTTSANTMGLPAGTKVRRAF